MRGHRRRIGILALLALAVPLPALALDDRSDAAAEPAGLTVAAALDACGIANSSILCKIDASWNPVPYADSYMVSVTRSDGSVIDFGATGAAMTSVWVPYAGPGSYTVVVEAWGTPPQEDEPELIARARSMSTADGKGGEMSTTKPNRRAGLLGEDRNLETPADGDKALTDPAEEESSAEEPDCEEPATPAVEPPVDTDADTIQECPQPPLPPSLNPPESSSNEVPESSSSEASG